MNAVKRVMNGVLGMDKRILLACVVGIVTYVAVMLYGTVELCSEYGFWTVTKYGTMAIPAVLFNELVLLRVAAKRFPMAFANRVGLAVLTTISAITVLVSMYGIGYIVEANFEVLNAFVVYGLVVISAYAFAFLLITKTIKHVTDEIVERI